MLLVTKLLLKSAISKDTKRSTQVKNLSNAKIAPRDSPLRLTLNNIEKPILIEATERSSFVKFAVKFISMLQPEKNTRKLMKCRLYYLRKFYLKVLAISLAKRLKYRKILESNL